MFIFVLVVGVAVLAGSSAGGRIAALSEIHPRWWGLALAGLVLQYAPLPDLPGLLGDVVAATVLLGSYGLLLAFMIVNARLPGSPLLIAGLALNLAVIGANGGMPVSEEALLASGQAHAVRLLGEGSSLKHHLMSSEDMLIPLADVIPVPPPVGVVVSVGDLVMYTGIACFVFSAMRGPVAARAPDGTWFEGYRGKHRPRRPGPSPRRTGLPARPFLPPAAARWGTER